MNLMTRACPLSQPPVVDWAAIRFPQQMRAADNENDVYYACPIRTAEGSMHLLWSNEAPFAAMWLLHRGNTVRFRAPGLFYFQPGSCYFGRSYLGDDWYNAWR